jgi:hypothetical protein
MMAAMAISSGTWFQEPSKHRTAICRINARSTARCRSSWPEAMLKEFEVIASRGGVLGATETG